MTHPPELSSGGSSDLVKLVLFYLLFEQSNAIQRGGSSESIRLIVQCPPSLLYRVLFRIVASIGYRIAAPDDFTSHHLKNLGLLELQCHVHLYNLSVNHCNISAIWLQAIIISIPKRGKPADLGTSFRPISHICPCVEVLKRLLHP